MGFPLGRLLSAPVYNVLGSVDATCGGVKMTFAGKAVLVTGSTTGIGEACAHVFAESGARVMVSGRHEPRGRAVV
jgi:NADPH:quinone reductase-like Zn-dependent oxidoreductase